MMSSAVRQSAAPRLRIRSARASGVGDLPRLPRDGAAASSLLVHSERGDGLLLLFVAALPRRPREAPLRTPMDVAPLRYRGAEARWLRRDEGRPVDS